MSVINKMLRDLDARQASEQERAGLSGRLRTLPAQRLANAGAWPVLAAGILAGGLIAGGAAWWLMPAVPVAAPAVVAVPPPAPPAVPIMPVTTETQAAAENALRPPIDLADMKLSLLLSLSQQAEPATPKPVSPKVESPKVAEAVEKKTPPPVATPPAAQPPKPAATAKSPQNDSVPAADAQIDKRTKGAMASEMADAEYRKGMQAVKRGDNAAAIPVFQRALELDPQLARARQALLSVLVGARQWADAQRIAQAGLALDPAQSNWAMILARLQFEQGDTPAAIDTLTRHMAHAQDNADYHGLFAYFLQKQQRPAEAAEHFRKALNLRPTEGRWWFGLGLALESAHRAGEAREAYQRARDTGNLSADMTAVIEQKLR